MAQKIITELLCDMHDDGTTPALHTITFEWNGSALEIDVCQKHHDSIEKSITPTIEKARRVTSNVRPISSGKKYTRTPKSPEAVKVREWARAQGMTMPDRGRIPNAISEQYAAAMS